MGLRSPVVSTARSSAVGIMLTPHSANRLEKRAISAMFHRRPALLTSTCTKRVETCVPDTDPDPREACRIRKKQNRTRVRARVLIERPVLRALGSRLLIPPAGGWVGMQVKNPQTRATRVNSEHHKASESSSANAQRMRATNLRAIGNLENQQTQNSQGSRVVSGWLAGG